MMFVLPLFVFFLLVLIFIYIFRGGRKLIHHPSLADFGAKRQIVVQKIPKAKVEMSLFRVSLRVLKGGSQGLPYVELKGPLIIVRGLLF